MDNHYRNFSDKESTDFQKLNDVFDIEASFITNTSFFNAPFQKLKTTEYEEDKSVDEKEDKMDELDKSLSDPSASLIFEDKANFVKDEERIEISWNEFLFHYLSCSLFLPLYFFRISYKHYHSQEFILSKFSLSKMIFRFLLSLFYYISFLSLIILYFIHLPSSFSASEIYFPIFLHFFSCFVWIFSSHNYVSSTNLLPSQFQKYFPQQDHSLFQSKREQIDEEHSSFETVDFPQEHTYLQEEGEEKANENQSEKEEESYLPSHNEKESILQVMDRSSSSNSFIQKCNESYFGDYLKFKKNQKKEMLKKKLNGKKYFDNPSLYPFSKEKFEEKEECVSELVNLLIKKTEEIGKMKKKKEWEILIPFFCSLLFSCLPQVWRMMNGLEINFEFKSYFYFLLIFSFLINFQISFVSFYVLYQTILNLKAKLLMAQLFNQLNSESSCFLYSLFYFKLQNFKNLWGWLSLRGYLMREGRKGQLVPEITLSTYLLFLIPLSFSILFEIFITKSHFSIFVVSGIFFSFLLFVHIIVCVRIASDTRLIYQSKEQLVTEQIELQFRIHNSTNQPQINQLKNLSLTFDKIIQFIDDGEGFFYFDFNYIFVNFFFFFFLQKKKGKAVVMKILGFEVTERMTQILIASAISFFSAGISKILI